MSGDVIEAEGTVTKVHAGGSHSVDVDLGGAKHTVLARRSGHLLTNKIRILPGDHVTVEISPYDTKRGRITSRERNG
jgi:translation initiation factor IF-1